MPGCGHSIDDREVSGMVSAPEELLGWLGETHTPQVIRVGGGCSGRGVLGTVGTSVS